MIAPIRTPTEKAPRRRAGVRRAHRWISKTLIEGAPSKPPVKRPKPVHLLAVGWIVLVAATFFTQLALNFWSGR